MNAPHRVSPLHDVASHAVPSPVTRDISGMPVVWQLADAATEAVRMGVIALSDASALRRMTIKGPGAAAFLQTQGLPIPHDILQIAPLDQGGLLVRTGASEFFLEDGPVGKRVERVEAALGHGGTGIYRVCRQDASICLCGPRVVDLFRQTCAFEFTTSLPTDRLIFTRIANLSCSVAPRVVGGNSLVQLWTDGTFGEYLWETLADVATELGGGPVGFGALFPDSAQA